MFNLDFSHNYDLFSLFSDGSEDCIFFPSQKKRSYPINQFINENVSSRVDSQVQTNDIFIEQDSVFYYKKGCKMRQSSIDKENQNKITYINSTEKEKKEEVKKLGRKRNDPSTPSTKKKRDKFAKDNMARKILVFIWNSLLDWINKYLNCKEFSFLILSQPDKELKKQKENSSKEYNKNLFSKTVKDILSIGNNEEKIKKIFEGQKGNKIIELTKEKLNKTFDEIYSAFISNNKNTIFEGLKTKEDFLKETESKYKDSNEKDYIDKLGIFCDSLDKYFPIN